MNEARDDRPISTLLLDVPDALARLMHQEMALARAELGERMMQLGIGIGMLVGAAIVLFVALLIVLMGLSELVGEFLPGALALWLGYIIIGGIAMAAGVLLLLRGMTNLRNAARLAERTTASIEQDLAALRNHLRRSQDHRS
jgi:Putative Actinobacterial Holin-X, holin superfamily III